MKLVCNVYIILCAHTYVRTYESMRVCMCCVMHIV